MQREASLSATVAGTLDLLNSDTYNADSQLTEITQQGQTGGNSVAAKRVDYTYTSTGQTSTINRYANLTGTQLVDTSTFGYNANSAPTSLSETKGQTGTSFPGRAWESDGLGKIGNFMPASAISG
jgi:hypothetical protein